MKILSRYIASSLWKGWLISALVLSAVFGLVIFIQELERTTDSYGVADVAWYVLLILPQQILSLAPVIALVGTIMALANLDRFNELTIVSCAGVSRASLLLAVLRPSLLLMLLLWVSMEFVISPLHQQGAQHKAAARHKHAIELPNGGVWSRHGSRYMHIKEIDEADVPGKIRLYEFDHNGQLRRALNAKTAKIRNGREWHFEEVRQKRIINGRLHTTEPQTLTIDELWSKAELPTITLSSQDMTLSVLYKYSDYLDANDQASDSYRLEFWKRLTIPLTVAAMILLATPISASLGSRRNRNFGVNMAIGAAIGIGFYLLAQINYSLGQLLGLDLLLICLLPPLAVLFFALILLRRMHW